MARTKNPVVEHEQPIITEAAAAHVTALQNDANQRLAEVLTKFGDGLPYATDRYEDKIRNHLSRSADEMLAAGRALIVVREHVPHGEWGEFLERLGLEDRLARRMCQAAIKFSNRATSPDLTKAIGNKSKLFELMVLDDEDIQELSDGGTVAGLNLDEIARMGTRDLRKKVRELQSDREATQKLLDAKNQKMDRLEAQLLEARTTVKPVPPPDETRIALSASLSGAAIGVEQAIAHGLREAISALLAHGREHGHNEGRDGAISLAAGCVMQVQQALNDVRNDFALPSFQNYVPDWLASSAAEPLPKYDPDAPLAEGDVLLADLALDPDEIPDELKRGEG